MSREPKAVSMVVVIDRALPSSSTIEIWLVPECSMVASVPNSQPARKGGVPGAALTIGWAASISLARDIR